MVEVSSTHRYQLEDGEGRLLAEPKLVKNLGQVATLYAVGDQSLDLSAKKVAFEQRSIDWDGVAQVPYTQLRFG